MYTCFYKNPPMLNKSLYRPLTPICDYRITLADSLASLGPPKRAVKNVLCPIHLLNFSIPRQKDRDLITASHIPGKEVHSSKVFMQCLPSFTLPTNSKVNQDFSLPTCRNIISYTCDHHTLICVSSPNPPVYDFFNSVFFEVYSLSCEVSGLRKCRMLWCLPFHFLLKSLALE